MTKSYLVIVNQSDQVDDQVIVNNLDMFLDNLQQWLEGDNSVEEVIAMGEYAPESTPNPFDLQDTV